MLKKSTSLSKSKIKLNNQCSKLLYLEVNHPDLKEISKKDATVFIVGREVEQIARDQFPHSKLVDSKSNEEKRNQTDTFLKEFPDKAIFEASFLGNNVHIQIDILLPKPDGTYKAIEVKSSSKAKDEYLEDIAIQFHTVEASGKIKISEYELWHVNTQGTPEDIFTRVSVLEKIIPLKDNVEKWRSEAQNTLDQEEAPVVSVGKQCDKPYGCPFKNQCWKNIQNDKNHILHLPFFEKKWDLFAQGVNSVDDERFKITDYKRPEILEALKENKMYINHQGIIDAINQWKAPYRFFDFESIMSYMPIFKGTRPYEQVVVQYSLHIMNSLKNTQPDAHLEFLHNSLSSPKETLKQKLINDLGTEGSIVSYQKTFEITRIKELAKDSDDLTKAKLLAICDRFVDLKDVIKDNLYHPDFKGSFSLKIVSPTLLGVENGGYTDSIIKSGSEITGYYLEYIKTEDLVRKEELRLALLKYCGYDTLNLILLTKWILSLVEQKSAA